MGAVDKLLNFMKLTEDEEYDEYDEYEDLDGQFGGDGAYQRGLELYLDIR